MINNSHETKTVCCFYASYWHLVTMLLPNIDKKINEGIEITTILENSLEDKMKTLINKLNLKNKERILNIGWKQKNIDKIGNENIEEEYIIINGSMEYIENVHKMLMQKVSKNITILDCYDIEENEKYVKEILNKHAKILNTSGEKDKEEYITKIRLAN